MAEEFREGPDGRQNEGRGNGERRRGPVSGARIAAIVATATVLLSAVAWFRWERPRELSAGVPMPRFARIEPDPGLEPPPGDGCRLILRLAGEPETSGPAWRAGLRKGGWELLGREEGGERLAYLREGVRLRVGTEPSANGRTTRLRLTFRPCPEDLAGRSDSRIVEPGP